MTDRELIELAAKASGVYRETDSLVPHFVNDYGKNWNPLTDDGDAFRLAVKLRIDVMWPRPGDHVCACNVQRQAAGSCEDDLLDPLAATRRAIVRAAAEIGRASHE